MKNLYYFLIITCCLIYSIKISAQTVIWSTGFETGDLTMTSDVAAGFGTITQPESTSPNNGANDGQYVSGGSGGTSGKYDGSFITSSTINFTTGKYYVVEVYGKRSTCGGVQVKIAKSATNTNAAMSSAAGADVFLPATTMSSTSYYLISSNVFYATGNESKYVGFRFTFGGAGGCSGSTLYIDDIIITEYDYPPCGYYCTAGGTTNTAGYISKVEFNSITRASSFDGYICTGTGTGVERTISYDLTVTRCNGSACASTYNLRTAAWIDWNIDGDFADAGENVMVNLNNNTTGAVARTVSVTVPVGATLGITKMRVMMKYNADITGPCDVSTIYTDVEDFDIEVLPAPTPMVYVSSTATQYQSGVGVNAGSSKQAVLKVEVVTSGTLSPFAATQMRFTSKGTTTPVVNNIKNARLYYTGLTNSFSTSTQVGTTVAAIPTDPTTFAFNFTKTLSSGTNYFWLTYDIQNNATAPDVVDGKYVDVTMNGGVGLKTINADPAGSRPIITATTSMTYVSSKVTQNTAPVARGDDNMDIIGIEVVTTGVLTQLVATSFTFNLLGTAVTPADVTDGKLWYSGVDNLFINATQVGGPTAPGTPFSIGCSVPLYEGTNYFWLTYKIAAGATCTRTADASCTSISLTNDPSSPRAPVPSSPLGSRAILCGTAFYSQGSLDASTPGNWNTIRGGGGTSAVLANFTDGSRFFVQNGHTMTTSVARTIDNIYIEGGGYIIGTQLITIGGELVIFAGGTYEQVVNSSTDTYINSFLIKNNGTWYHNNTGMLPGQTRIFEPNSNQYMRKWGANTWPGSPAYGNLTLDFPENTSNWLMDVSIINIQGNLEFKNSNGKWMVDASTETISVGGNLIISGGIFDGSIGLNFMSGLCNQTPTLTVNVTGDLIVSAGTLQDVYCGKAGVKCIYNIGGNVNISGGTVNLNKDGSGNSELNLTGGTASVTWSQTGGVVTLAKTNIKTGKTVTMTGTKIGDVASTRTITVETGATLNCSTYPVTGAGLFTLQTGATLGIGHSAGIESSGATGNVQVTGTRSYNSGATYRYYESTSPQSTGAFSPTTDPNIANLIIDKTSATNVVNITKGSAGANSFNITNVLTINNGEFNLNTRTLTVTNAATSAVVRNGGYIVSEELAATNRSILQWNIGGTTGAHVFPFGYGGDYLPVTFNNSGASGNVSISTRRTASNDNTPWATGVSNMSGIGTNITTAADRWWEITSSAALPLPAVALTLSYRGAENATTTSQTDTRGVQHWNSTSSCWDDGKNGGCGTVTSSSDAGVTTGVGTVAVTGITYFSPFVVVRAAAPLPIELTNFVASPYNNSVILNWETASEINNEYFTIERSKDGKEFEQVANVKSKAPGGNSSVQLEYADKDGKPYKGVSYYRLKQTDFDGKYAYSDIVAVNLKEGVTNLFVYPNPANDRLNIVIGENNKSVVKIYDITGQVVAESVICSRLLSGQPTGICNVDIASLPKGVYFVSLNDGTDVRYARFVKD